MKKFFLIAFFSITCLINNILAQTPVVYENTHFSGKSQSLKAGDYRSADLAGVGNDAISSVRVPDGFKLIVFENDNFEGDFFEITTSIPSLDFWSDRISSIRVIDLQNRNITNNQTTAPATTTNNSNNTSTPNSGNTPQNQGGSNQPWWAGSKPSINYSDNDIVIFADKNFQGQGQVLAEGRYNDRQLTIGNDALSSIKVPQGYTVRLFEHGNFDGRTLDIKADVSDLATLRWDNLTSSIQVFKGDAPSNMNTGSIALLYQHSNFDGRNQALGEGRYLTKDFGLAHDLTSLRVMQGYYVRLFEQDNFRGASIDITGDVNDLSSMGWNDRAMSLQVIRGLSPTQQFNNNTNNNQNWNPNQVTFYQLANYAGRMMSLPEGNYGTLSGMQVGNYDISSIRVPMGFTVRLYSRENGQGSFVDITQDTDNLSRIGWDNRAVSLQVIFTGNQFGNNRNSNNSFPNSNMPNNNMPNNNLPNSNFPNNNTGFYSNFNRSFRMTQNGTDFRIRIANSGGVSQIQTQSGMNAWTDVLVISADNQRGYYRIRDNSGMEYDVNLQNNGRSLTLSSRNGNWTYFAE
jgi:hypothetical protein